MRTLCFVLVSAVLGFCISPREYVLVPFICAVVWGLLGLITEAVLPRSRLAPHARKSDAGGQV